MASRAEQITVLVVDDDLDIRDTLETFVEKTGRRAVTADRASRALSILEMQQIDLVLLDLYLPGPHGQYVLNCMQSKRRWMPPTIVVSAYLTKDMVPQLIELGVDGIVAKPFTLTRLGEEIDRVLAEHAGGERFCTRCGKPYNLDEPDCPFCGFSGERKRACHSCHAEWPISCRYCGSCGHMLA